MPSVVLAEDRRMLARLIKQGAGLTFVGGGPTSLPIGGAIFQHTKERGWELLWVMMWPENEFATHWQPFARLHVPHEQAISLLDENGKLIGDVGTLDPSELRGCRWEGWIGKSADARRARKFVRECLRIAGDGIASP
jgi:hypothetical protein